MTAQACREVLLTPEVKARAAALAGQGTGDPTLAEMLGKLAAGVAVEGMEALIPVLVPGALVMLPELLAPGTYVVFADPERIRTRAEDLVRTGADFLAASWMAAATGGKAPIDLAESAYRSLGQVQDMIRDHDLPLWRIAPFGVDQPGGQAGVDQPGVGQPGVDQAGVDQDAPQTTADFLAAPAYRGEIAVAIDDARERAAHGGATVVVVPGAGTAARAAERLAEAELAVTLTGDTMPNAPRAGMVTVARGQLEDGFIIPSAGLAVITESDLTGTRGAAAQTSPKTVSRRRNAVDPLALKPGDYVVHAQHGIGKYIDLVSRTSGGAVREYLVVEYAPSKRGHPGDRLFVPTDSLDLLSRYIGGELPTVNKLGGADWAKAKGRARKAVRDIAAKTRPALRRSRLRARARVRAGHAVAARVGGRLPVHRDARPDGGHRRGQGRHGEGRADGPGHLR